MKLRVASQFLLGVIMGSIFMSCDREKCCDHNSKTIIGTGDLVSKTIILGIFNHFTLEGQGSITITKGDTLHVTLRAQQNIMDVLKTEIINNALVLSQNDNNIQTSKGIFLDIITPNAISDIDIFGAGNINISGDKQNSLNISISGTGDINAYNLEVDNCNLQMSGTGNCKVFVDKNLNISISGIGNVLYRGNPIVIQSISGIGTVASDN
jgi:hypothetical protein